MRKLILSIVLCVSVVTAFAQTPPTGNVERVDVEGIPNETLGTELRAALRALVGKPYDPQAAAELATRIESQVPNVLAAPRPLAGSNAGSVRLVFVVARTAAGASDGNVNSQYVVESVEVKGLMRSGYSDALHEDMQKLVGQKLDNNKAEDLRVRLTSEVPREYYVEQKIERGSKPEHVKVVFEVEKTPWLVRKTVGGVLNGNISHGSISIGSSSHDKDTVEAVELKGIAPALVSDKLNKDMQAMVGKQVDNLEINHLRDQVKEELKNDYKVATKVTSGSGDGQARVVFDVDQVKWLPYRAPDDFLSYHSKQGFSLMCCWQDFIGDYTTLLVGTNGDTLTERYKGFNFGIESTSLGTRRLGARLNFDSYGVSWKDATRIAHANTTGIPPLYRSRIGVAPSVAFAFNRNAFVTAGADFTELRLEGTPSTTWQAAHAATASLNLDSKKIERGKTKLEHVANYEVRSGARSIGSDFTYTRHFVSHRSTFGHGEHALTLSASGGKITGVAPWFERFSLGNTQTLRGWNKFDIDPLGGSRVWHGSLGYNYSGDIGFFMDMGDVWDPGVAHEVRTSVGIELGRSIGLAFPVRCSEHCGPTFYFHFF